MTRSAVHGRAWSCMGVDCEERGVQTTGGRLRQWCSDVCRKRTLYGVVCAECGHRTNGSQGFHESPVCALCLTWTREAALLACDEFFAKNGYAPALTSSCGKLGGRHQDPDARVPHSETARRLFGGWNKMLLAAGLPLNMDRQPETQSEVERLYVQEGWTLQEIADHYGWCPSNVWQRLTRAGVAVTRRRAA